MTHQRRRLTGILTWALLVGALSISYGSNSQMAVSRSPGQTPLPGADAQQLWKYITKDNPYKSWKSPPNQSTRYVHVNENPHGDWVAVYLNAEANESITYPTTPFQMKYGAVIVKENYSLLKGDPISQPPLNAVPVELVSLTVMYKLKGYQSVPGEQEWFWVMFTCRNGQCDGSVATISDQAFVNEQIPMSQDKFAFFQGEVVAGKPWICIECHQRANISNEFSYGDYVWKLKAFAPK